MTTRTCLSRKLLTSRGALARADKSLSLSATGEVDGVPGSITSLRAEGRGSIAITLLLVLLHHKWPDILPPSCTLELFFDSTITIFRADTSPRRRKDFLGPDFDLWAELRRVRNFLPFRLKFSWVQSHQDSSTDCEPTLTEVLLNIEVDKMAGAISSTMTSTPPTLLIPAGEVAVVVNGTRYHHFPATVIRDLRHGPPLQAYIQEKTGWTDAQFCLIDWDAYSRILSSLSTPQRVNWIKLAMNWQHTGSQKSLMLQEDRASRCPFA